MFLSNIENKKVVFNTNQILLLFKILKFIKIKNISKPKLFSKIKVKQTAFGIEKNEVQHNLVSYVLKINLTKTNTLVTITDVLGSKIETFSSGIVGLTKRQKHQQPIALTKIFKFLLLKHKNLKNKIISLQFTNTKSKRVFKLLDKLNLIFFINSIKSYSFHPHNGCRPKKLKRFKRRTKRRILN